MLEEYPPEDVLRSKLNTQVLTTISQAPLSAFQMRAGDYGVLWVRPSGATADAMGAAGEQLGDIGVRLLSERYRWVYSSERLVQRFLAIVSVVLLVLSGASVSTFLFLSTHIRTWEIGVRLAIGATPSSVRFLLVQDAVVLALKASLAGGLIGSCVTFLAWTVGLELRFGFLHGVALALPVVVCLVASVLPAFHVSRLIPATALGRRKINLNLFRGVSGGLVGILLAVCIAAAGIYSLWTIFEGSTQMISRLWGNVDNRLVWVAAPEDSILMPPVLTIDDSSLLSMSQWIELVVPTAVFGVAITDPASKRIQAHGVAEGYSNLRGLLTITRGRDLLQFELIDGRRSALLGDALSRTLFGDEDPIGRDVVTEEGIYTVVGTFNDQGTAYLGTARMIVPYSTLGERARAFAEIGFWVLVREAGNVERSVSEIREILQRQHPDNAEVEIGSPAKIIQEQKRQLAPILVQLLLVMIAVLALSMLNTYATINYSLALQRRQLGIRLALGARPVQVMWHGARLALAIGLSASICGVLLGLWLAPSIATYLHVDYAPSWEGILTSFLIISLLSLTAGGVAAIQLACGTPAQIIDRGRQ